MSVLLRPSHRFAGALAALVVLAGCGTTNVNYVTGENQRGAYTWAQEVQLGREADQSIQAQFGVYDDPAVAAYVEQIGQKVLQTSAYTDPNTPAEIRNTPFTFRVLDATVPNAFALPGGFIYVTRGLMAYLDNEAQLAVVLGHEAGHVLGRHSSKQAAQAQLGQLGLLGAAIAGGVIGGGDVAQGILEYGGTGVQLLFLKYSRDAERQADQAGVAYAEYAGYDAAQAARFFTSLERLGEESGGSVPGFFSTHPDPGDRAQTIPALAAQYDSGKEVNEARYLSVIENMVLGDDPRQGYAENGRFYHPELRFSLDYPSGWKVHNSAQAVQFGEPNGRAVLQLTLAPQSTAVEAARAFAGQQGIQVTRSGQTQVHGNPAAVVEGAAAGQQGTIGFVATFIEYGGNVYQLAGLTAQNTLSQYERAFRSAADSFQRLTDARYLNRQPSRIEVVTLSRASTLRSLLSGRTIPAGLTTEEVAIMNETTLDASLPAGTKVKLPS